MSPVVCLVVMSPVLSPVLCLQLDRLQPVWPVPWVGPRIVYTVLATLQYTIFTVERTLHTVNCWVYTIQYTLLFTIEFPDGPPWVHTWRWPWPWNGAARWRRQIITSIYIGNIVNCIVMCSTVLYCIVSCHLEWLFSVSKGIWWKMDVMASSWIKIMLLCY